MTPFRLGHRAAAQCDDKNPFDFKTQPAEHDQWVNGAAAVKAHREKGLDPRGHQPPIPHLCIRASRTNPAVCNCCQDCQAVCWIEGVVKRVDDAPKLIRGPLVRLVKKIFG